MSAFLHSVDVFLGKLGFVCSDAFDDHVYVSYWQRPVAWADNFFEFVAMLEQSRTRERSEVSARIGIASQLLTDVENAADLWQCGTGALDPLSLPWRFQMPLIQVALHWLSRNKGSELKTGWAIRGSGGESDAASFYASFE